MQKNIDKIIINCKLLNSSILYVYIYIYTHTHSDGITFNALLFMESNA